MSYTDTPFHTQRTPLRSSYSSTVTPPTNQRSGTIATLKRKRSKTINATNPRTSTIKRQQLSNRPPPLSRASTNTIPETIVIESSDEGSKPTIQSKEKRTYRTSLSGEDHNTATNDTWVIGGRAGGECEALPNGASAGHQGNTGQDVQGSQSDGEDVPQRPARRSFNPIPLDLLPRWNPFLRATLPDDADRG